MAATYQVIGAANSTYPNAGLSYKGGERTFAIYGTWGGATVKVQASFSGGAEASTFIYLSDSEGAQLAFNDDAIFRINMGACLLRFETTGGNGSDTDLVVKVS